MNTAKDFRQSARESLRGNWKIAVGAGFVASLFGATQSFTPDINFEFRTTTNVNSASSLPQGIIDYLPLIIAVIALFAIIMTILQWIVQPGYAKFNLDVADGVPELRAKTLFRYFNDWRRMACAGFLRDIYTMLWTLLLFIPGIIAQYNYAMTSYILAEHPELSANEAISLSKRMMRGNRWRLFCLEFSFIGWAVLTIFTLGIGSLWLIPYVQAAFAHFYREVSASYAE